MILAVISILFARTGVYATESYTVESGNYLKKIRHIRLSAGVLQEIKEMDYDYGGIVL